jgi:hypothetical protein
MHGYQVCSELELCDTLGYTAVLHESIYTDHVVRHDGRASLVLEQSRLAFGSSSPQTL